MVLEKLGHVIRHGRRIETARACQDQVLHQRAMCILQQLLDVCSCAVGERIVWAGPEGGGEAEGGQITLPETKYKFAIRNHIRAGR